MKMMNKTTLILLILALAFPLVSQSTTGRIQGIVTLEDGQNMPGVKVTALSPSLIGEATTFSDENGCYRLLALPPGRYTLKFELEGYVSEIKKSILVFIEQTITLNIKMDLEHFDKLPYRSDYAAIDLSKPAVAKVLSKEEIGTLPRGRDFTSLVHLMPSVNREPRLAGISIDGASGAENLFFIDGMETTGLYQGTNIVSAAYEFADQVQVKTRGISAQYSGSTGGVIQVVTRSGANQFHGSLIGYYSGTAFKGKDRDTLRLDPYDTSKYEYVNYQDEYGRDPVNTIEPGFSLSGFVLKDRIWFHAILLPVFQKTERTIEWLYPNNTTKTYARNETWWNMQGKLSALISKNLRFSASYVNNYYQYRGSLPGRFGIGSYQDVWDEYGFDFPAWTMATSLDYQLGNNLLIHLGGGYTYKNQTNQGVSAEDEPRWAFWAPAPSGYPDTTNAQFYADPNHADIRPLGWTNYGNSSGLETKKEIRERTSIHLDLNYFLSAAGEHSIKAGGQWSKLREDIDQTYTHPYILFAWGMSKSFSGKIYTGKYGYYGVRGGGPNHPSGPYGSYGQVSNHNLALYIQDDWTIAKRLTLTLGVRAEREEIPSYVNPADYPDLADTAYTFDFDDKIAPRLGFVLDLLGNSAVKLYGSYGIYYDRMKRNYPSGSYGLFKWKTSYYTLDTLEWWTIGKNGNYPGIYIGTSDWRPPNFETTDPSLKPMSQQEISLGAEAKLAPNLLAAVRLVNKHLRYAVEDVGIIIDAAEYYTCNPGYGYSLPQAQGGKFNDQYPACPKAKREYWAVNISLDKKFADNWWAGFSYTWSRLSGNYSGLASSDEQGRNDPNVERYFDLWHLAFDKNLNPIDGPLPTDRTHQFKVYGSYAFPFGLTLGTILHGLSGTPVSTELSVWANGYLPNNRGDLGRTPFLFWADFYGEYTLKIGQTRLSLSINIDNVFNTDTAQGIWSRPYLDNLSVSYEQLLNGNWQPEDYHKRTDPRFKKEYDFFPPIQARLGFKFSF